MEKEIRDHVFGKKFMSFVHGITVEPIVFCNFLAIAFFRVAEHSGLYEVICNQNYELTHHVDCKNLKDYPEVEDMVQQDASNLNIYFTIAYLLPAIASDLFLGAWSDRNGRKVNIMLGLAGLIVQTFPYAIVFTFPQTSLVLLLVANLVAGITGYIGIVMISSFAYLTDIVHDKSTLTVRLAQVSVCQTAAGAIGSFIAGYLLRRTSFPYIVLVTEAVLFVGFIYTMIRIKQLPPLIMRQLIDAKAKAKLSPIKSVDTTVAVVKTESSKTGIVEKKDLTCMESVNDNFKFIGTMYKEFWHTFTRNRFGHRRCHIYLMTVVYLLFFVSELGLLHGPVLSLYVFRRPFDWKPSDLAYWKGTQSILLMLGNMFGSLIMKKLLVFRDTTVILVCLTSGICHLTLTAFCNQTWMLYLAIAIGMLANLTIPSIKSFIAQSVEPNEVGKAFTANGVTADVAFVLSALLFNSIYSATVTFFAGIVFLFAAFLMLICFFIVLWIHIDKAKTEPEIIKKKPIVDDVVIRL